MRERSLGTTRRFFWPFAFTFGALFLLPIALTLGLAFFRRGLYGGIEWTLTTEAWARLADPSYLEVLVRTGVWALGTAAACLLIALPYAYFLTRERRPWVREALWALVLLPFFTNFLIRTFALKSLCQGLGIEGAPAVLFGMLTNYLPIAVIPMVGAFYRFDAHYEEVAKDLGASEAVFFFKVFLPIKWPSVTLAFLLVFTPSLGEFVVPTILGDASTLSYGTLIADQFLKQRDWPFGSALTWVLMMPVLAGVYFMNQAGKRESA